MKPKVSDSLELLVVCMDECRYFPVTCPHCGRVMAIPMFN